MVTTSDFLIVQSCSNPISISFTSQRAPKPQQHHPPDAEEGKLHVALAAWNPSCSTWSAFCTRPKKHCRFFSNRISSQEIEKQQDLTEFFRNFYYSIKFIWQQRTSCLSHAISKCISNSEGKRGLLSRNKSLWIYLHQLMETIFLRNLCDNLFSSLSIALSLTDDNKIQWNYIWALKCTSAYRFLMTWVFILPMWLIHSQYYSQAFKVYVWAMCHAYIKVRNTEVIIYVYICIYAHIQCTRSLAIN